MTNTDANGSFEWDSAPAEDTHYIFEADGFQTMEDQAFPSDGNNHQIVLHRNHRDR